MITKEQFKQALSFVQQGFADENPAIQNLLCAALVHGTVYHDKGTPLKGKARVLEIDSNAFHRAYAEGKSIKTYLWLSYENACGLDWANGLYSSYLSAITELINRLDNIDYLKTITKDDLDRYIKAGLLPVSTLTDDDYTDYGHVIIDLDVIKMNYFAQIWLWGYDYVAKNFPSLCEPQPMEQTVDKVPTIAIAGHSTTMGSSTSTLFKPSLPNPSEPQPAVATQVSSVPQGLTIHSQKADVLLLAINPTTKLMVMDYGTDSETWIKRKEKTPSGANVEDMTPDEIALLKAEIELYQSEKELQTLNITSKRS